MATKKVKPAWQTPGKEWMEDNDDAHFVPKTPAKKSRNVPVIGKSRRVVNVTASEAVKGSRKKYARKTARKAVSSK